jgi:hypothetical protein
LSLALRRSCVWGFLLFGACEAKLPDPPPAAKAQELPLAPPGARGARSANLDPPVMPAEPLFEVPPDEEAEEDEGGGDAGPTTMPPSETQDSGVAL